MKEFLNKIHYGIFLFSLDIHFKLENLFLKIAPKNNTNIIKNNLIKNHKMIRDYQVGPYTYISNHLFGGSYSSYFLFLSFILLGIRDAFFETKNEIVTLLLMGLPVLVGYIPAYKAVLSNDVYLKYYKKFEKKDAQWQRKCKWLAVAFCLGGFLTMILGLFAYAFIGEMI